jgi:DNA-directed RNA polymerase III subunit RPC6
MFDGDEDVKPILVSQVAPSSTSSASSSGSSSASTRSTHNDKNQLTQQIQNRILTICRKYPDGVTDEELREEFKSLRNDSILVDAINQLLNQRRLRLFQTGNTLIYKEVSHEEAAKFSGLTPEDITVYQIIEKGDNKGVWTKDIKFRSKLQPKQIATILKKLKTKNLIKPVKTIHGKNKIVYMLANIEPSREITGGVWYSGTEYNSPLIEKLQKECCTYVYNRKFVSADQILEYIRSSGICSEVDLREEDIVSILNTLIYDGLIEQTFDLTSHRAFFKPSGTLTPTNAFSEIPCSTCPVFDQCTDGGDINPRDCPYLKTWMEL